MMISSHHHTKSNLDISSSSSSGGASSAEILIKCCTEIVRELLDAHIANEAINLNALKARVAKKYSCKVMPRLVDIIAAVPNEVKDILLPKLRAKPVRTASGVSFTFSHSIHFLGVFLAETDTPRSIHA